MEHEAARRMLLFDHSKMHYKEAGMLPTTPVTSPMSSPAKSPNFAMLSPMTPSSHCQCCDSLKELRPAVDADRLVSEASQKRKSSSCRWSQNSPVRKAPRTKVLVVDDTAARRGYSVVCEYCSNIHDGTYGSGRFCSVHCARRVAASRKWEKQRDAKKRTEGKGSLVDKQRSGKTRSASHESYASYGTSSPVSVDNRYPEVFLPEEFSLSHDTELTMERARTNYVAEALLTLSSGTKPLIADV